MTTSSSPCRNSAQHFGVFRIIFGLYLTCHFISLLPYATELFGATGMFGSNHPSPFRAVWPNPLFFIDWAPLANYMVALGILSSILLTIGRLRRSAAIYLWFLSSCLFTANPFISNPSLGYTGLLLLLSALTPLGEAFVLGKPSQPNWRMPRMIPITAWILLAVGYTFSGFLKLDSPSWIDGSALRFVLENPLARPNFLRDFLLQLPDFTLEVLTWSTLLLELFFLPLAFYKKTRPWAWLAMIGMHLGIIMVIDFADLSLGMLMIHLFTYQSSWLPARKANSPHVLFIDGQCSFCQRSVRAIMHIDTEQVLRFAPLQGKTAEQLPENCRLKDSPRYDTVILLENSMTPRIWRGTDAVLRAIFLSGGISATLWPLHLLPYWLKSRVYQSIAYRRHKLSNNCPIPSPQQQQLFLP